jgi:hypothetical protein
MKSSAKKEPDNLSKLIEVIQSYLEAWTKKDESGKGFIERYKKQERESNKVIQKALDWQSQG